MFTSLYKAKNLTSRYGSYVPSSNLSTIDSTVRQLFMCVNMEENKFSKHYYNKINDGITAECPCWFPSVTIVNDGITAE